jgi:hypothetical protein
MPGVSSWKKDAVAPCANCRREQGCPHASQNEPARLPEQCCAPTGAGHMNTAESRVSDRVVVQYWWAGTDLSTMRLAVRQEIVDIRIVWTMHSLCGDELFYGLISHED